MDWSVERRHHEQLCCKPTLSRDEFWHSVWFSSIKSVPEGQPRVAPRFSFGNRGFCFESPEGRLRGSGFVRSFSPHTLFKKFINYFSLGRLLSYPLWYSSPVHNEKRTFDSPRAKANPPPRLENAQRRQISTKQILTPCLPNDRLNGPGPPPRRAYRGPVTRIGEIPMGIDENGTRFAEKAPIRFLANSRQFAENLGKSRAVVDFPRSRSRAVTLSRFTLRRFTAPTPGITPCFPGSHRV